MTTTPHRRRDFSFSDAPTRADEHLTAWVRPPRPPANPLVARAGEEEFRWLARRDDSDSGSGSGTPSPPLWNHAHHYPVSAGSSPSRAQVIAGYRREMLDMVRGLPEATYELSLRDIVEAPPRRQSPEQVERRTEEVKKEEEKEEEAKNKKKSKTKKLVRRRSRSMERSVSLDTGLLIKMFLPLSVGGGKKKSFGGSSGGGAKVSPKPGAKDLKKAGDGKKKEKEKAKEKEKKKAKEKEKEVVQEEEWWKKSEFSETGSSSRTSSTGSNSSSNGSIRSNMKTTSRSRSCRKRTGCYAFFGTNKSRTRGA